MGRKIRWLARGMGVLAGAFWSFSLLASFIVEVAEGKFQPSLEGAILAALVTTAVVGIIIAWRREKVGGVVVTAAAVALCIFAYVSAGYNKPFAVLVSGVPFLVTGLLFLISSRGSRGA